MLAWRRIFLRRFSDRGAKRKDLSDTGFVERGYAAIDDYSCTHKGRRKNGDKVPGLKRGVWRNSHAPAKIVELDSYDTTKWKKQPKRKMGDARRAYEQQKQESMEE